VEYEDRVLSVPNITRSKPGYYVGKITNEGGTVELDNADGYFDRFFKNVTALGNVIRTKLGLAHYNLEKYVKIFTGNILKAKTGTRKMLVDVKELTGALDATINPNRYNISEFAFLNTSNAGKTKPTGYGKLNDFPVVCVNETQSPAPANYIFHVLDTTWHPMHDLTAAYTYDGDVRTARTPLNIDLAAGTFELAAADYTPGQEVTVDCEAADDGAGNPIENALDVMSSLIVDHTPAQYTASYFRSWDTTNAADIGIAFTSETSVEKAIEEITQKGTLAYFCVENDGRYSALMFDATEPSDVTLQECDIKRMAEVEDTKDELVGTLVVKYDRQIKRGTYKTVTDNTYQSDVNWLYETASQKEIETVISNTADAADFAARFQAEYGVPGKYVEVTTALFPYALRITKIITLPVTRVKNIAIGTYRGEVRGITVNYNDNEVTFRLRLFEEVVT